MHVEKLDESVIKDIGHAFGYYDYKGEKSLFDAFPSRDAVAEYISGYVRGMLNGGLLYTTSERGEGYIAYKLPGAKLGLNIVWPIAKAAFSAMSLKELFKMMKAMSKNSKSLRDRMDKEKKPYIFVGLVCVREQYQGQGYMRKILDIAFKEGNRLGVPVVLETDAKSKCDKYMHLGMELAGTRSCGEFGALYDLIKYPDKR